jgi:hypothetical protein
MFAHHSGYLDRLFFWNTLDLARKLTEFKDYYNVYRVHQSLDGKTPAQCADALSPAPISLVHHAWRTLSRFISDPDRRLITNSPPHTVVFDLRVLHGT